MKKKLWSKIALFTLMMSVFIPFNGAVVKAASSVSNFTVQRTGLTNEYVISFAYQDLNDADILLRIIKSNGDDADGFSADNAWVNGESHFFWNDISNHGNGSKSVVWYAPQFTSVETYLFNFIVVNDTEGSSTPIANESVSRIHNVVSTFSPDVSNLNVTQKAGSQTEYEITFDHEDFLMDPNPAATYVQMDLVKILPNGGGETVIAKWDTSGSNGYTKTFDQLYLNGTAKVTWDSATSGAGFYEVRLNNRQSSSLSSSILKTLEKDFVVDNSQMPPAPTTEISNLQVNPDPYDPTEGAVTLSYSVSNITANTTTKVSIWNPSNIEVMSWNVANADVGDAITWNAPSSLAEGIYTLKVEGQNGSGSLLTTKTKTFVVDKDTTPPPSTKCAGFTDVAANHPDCTAITWAKSTGAFTGNPDGTLRLDDYFQRDQSAKVMLEVPNKYNEQTNYCGGSSPFTDVSLSSWSANYICRAKNLGIVTGYLSGSNAGKFLPGATINHYEFAAMAVRLTGDTVPSNSSASYNDVPTGEWFSGYAKYAKNNNLFPGSNLYGTKATTRLEVIQVLYKLHQLGKI